jgi:hypothetical protein
LALAIHVIRGFSENTSTGCLGASKVFVDRRDTKCDGVRPKGIGLRSNVQLLEAPVKIVFDHVTRRFNALSAGLKGPVGGLNLR